MVKTRMKLFYNDLLQLKQDLGFKLQTVESAIKDLESGEAISENAKAMLALLEAKSFKDLAGKIHGDTEQSELFCFFADNLHYTESFKSKTVVESIQKVFDMILKEEFLKLVEDSVALDVLNNSLNDFNKTIKGIEYFKNTLEEKLKFYFGEEASAKMITESDSDAFCQYLIKYHPQDAKEVIGSTMRFLENANESDKMMILDKAFDYLSNNNVWAGVTLPKDSPKARFYLLAAIKKYEPEYFEKYSILYL